MLRTEWSEGVSGLPSVEEVARIIDPDSWRVYDTGALPKDHVGAQRLISRSSEKALAILALFGATDD